MNQQKKHGRGDNGTHKWQTSRSLACYRVARDKRNKVQRESRRRNRR